MAAPMRVLRVVLLLLCAAAAGAEPMPHMAMAHSHAAARLLGAPATPIRADYIGTQFITDAPCTNGLTCSPQQARAAA
jgi:hypothetical protein